MERTRLKEKKIGDTFIGFCVVRKKELKHKKDGEPYVLLEVGDRSGRLRGKIWNNAHEFYTNLKVGQLIKLKGRIQSFKDTREIHIERLRIARKEEENALDELIPKSEKDIEALKQNFVKHIEGIRNPHLKQLIETLFPNEEEIEEYLKTPSGKLWHHNYLYGMLEHLVCLLDLAEVMHVHYPIIQIDLLKTGILLHNLGKHNEYAWPGFIDYTTEGRLIGHITKGYEIAHQAIIGLNDFPEELRLQILHLILSHQGTTETGSPVPPMTLEAIVLHLMDELDSKTNATRRIILNDQLPESNWTKYNNLLHRFIYVPHKTENNIDDKQDQ